jgi:hypothetical protein
MQMTGASRKSEMPAGQKAAHPAQAAHAAPTKPGSIQLTIFLNGDYYKN